MKALASGQILNHVRASEDGNTTTMLWALVVAKGAISSSDLRAQDKDSTNTHRHETCASVTPPAPNTI